MEKKISIIFLILFFDFAYYVKGQNIKSDIKRTWYLELTHDTWSDSDTLVFFSNRASLSYNKKYIFVWNYLKNEDKFGLTVYDRFASELVQPIEYSPIKWKVKKNKKHKLILTIPTNNDKISYFMQPTYQGLTLVKITAVVCDR